ncbi:MAG: hypothetical protein R3F30_10100 [Planctomycetota bacterium]
MAVDWQLLLALGLRALAGLLGFDEGGPGLPRGLSWFLATIFVLIGLQLFGGLMRVDFERRGLRAPAPLRLLRAVLPAVPLVGFAVCLFPGEWIVFVERVLGPTTWTLRELLVLFPFLWFQALGLLSSLRIAGTPAPAWLRLRRTLAWLPVLVGGTLAVDVVGRTQLGWSLVEELRFAEGALALLGALLAWALHGLWVPRLLDTSPPRPGPWAEAVRELGRSLGVTLGRVALLDEDTPGWRPRFIGWLRPLVLLPRRVVDLAHPHELETWLRQALAVLRLRPGLRLALLGGSLTLCFTLLVLLGTPPAADRGLLALVLGSFAFFEVGMLAFLHRRYVHEADLASRGDGLDRVLSRLGRELRDEGTVFEPSIDERLQLLGEVATREDPRHGYRLRTRLLEAMLLLLVLAGGSLVLPRLGRDVTRAWPWVLLDLGRIDAADRELRALPGLEHAEALRDRIARAREIDYEDPGLDELHHRAIARARLVIERSTDGPRRRADLGAADARAFRNDCYRQAEAWLDLARRWGGQRRGLAALQLGLRALIHDRPRDLDRSRSLLRSLDLPSSLDRVVRVVMPGG